MVGIKGIEHIFSVYAKIKRNINKIWETKNMEVIKVRKFREIEDVRVNHFIGLFQEPRR
jgi:hypothetical protein